VLTSQEACDIVASVAHLGAAEAVRELVHTAYDAGSFDNISAVLVLLKKPAPPPADDDKDAAAGGANSSIFTPSMQPGLVNLKRSGTILK
jgi:hypothetical protein